MRREAVARGDVYRALALGLVAAIIGSVAALAIDWFPTQASEEAEQIDRLWDITLLVSIPIFVLVEGAVLFMLWKFRMRPGEEELDGPPIHGNTKIEIYWTVIPAVILVVLCVAAYVVLVDIEEEDGNRMVVNVSGQQFAWTFEYPKEGDRAAITSNQLYIPKGRQVEFRVTSQDVIHDFWIPAMRMKIDAVPGRETKVLMTPKKVGDWPVVCAELCGLGHAAMRQTAHVMEPADFKKWLDKEARPAAPADGGVEPQGGAEPGSSDPAPDSGQTADTGEGKAIFNETGCNACHVLADAGASGQIGPSLDETLKGRDPQKIREGIVDPAAEIADGYPENVMPENYGEQLDEQELAALVAYLSEVTK